MAGLKEIRTRIGSVKSTRQVTSAMKLVSAAKLKKAQDAVIGFRPYARKYEEIFNSLLSRTGTLPAIDLVTPREGEKTLIIVISSNRGLCGGFNSAAVVKAFEVAFPRVEKEKDNGQLHFLAIGKQGERLLKNFKMPVVGNRNELMEKLTFPDAEKVATQIMDDFRHRMYDRVELVYNDFINATQYHPVHETLLPLVVSRHENDFERGSTLFEPSIPEMLPGLIPVRIKIQFYKALLISHTAEHGARMTAMHQATDNATDLLGELVLQYNKARQAAITGEILEITGGAEAQSL